MFEVFGGRAIKTLDNFLMEERKRDEENWGQVQMVSRETRRDFGVMFVSDVWHLRGSIDKGLFAKERLYTVLFNISYKKIEVFSNEFFRGC
jgi:hypothetical protein